MTLTTDKVANKKLNDEAWNYLVMACENEPFDIITSKTVASAYIAWEKLNEEYEPETAEALIDNRCARTICEMQDGFDD
jgi:hypothetical protein